MEGSASSEATVEATAESVVKRDCGASSPEAMAISRPVLGVVADGGESRSER